jgi:hypothetical protein
MSAIHIPRIKAFTLLHPLSSGRTKSCLMLCTDEEGNDYEAVIKWRAGKEMCERALVCELMAAMLADDLDLPVPKPFIVEIASNFHVGDGKPELAAIAKKSAGLNFGSQKLPVGVGTWPKDKPIPVLLRPIAAEIFAFDVLFRIQTGNATTQICYGAATKFFSATMNRHFHF